MENNQTEYIRNKEVKEIKVDEEKPKEKIIEKVEIIKVEDEKPKEIIKEEIKEIILDEEKPKEIIKEEIIITKIENKPEEKVEIKTEIIPEKKEEPKPARFRRFGQNYKKFNKLMYLSKKRRKIKHN